MRWFSNGKCRNAICIVSLLFLACQSVHPLLHSLTFASIIILSNYQSVMNCLLHTPTEEEYEVKFATDNKIY